MNYSNNRLNNGGSTILYPLATTLFSTIIMQIFNIDKICLCWFHIGQSLTSLKFLQFW